MRKAILLLWAVTSVSSLLANQLQISNVRLVANDTVQRLARIQLDVQWDNSWRDALNHDAAWVFFKYRTSGSNQWRHLQLASLGHQPGNGVQYKIPTDLKGAFLLRSSNGSGQVQFLQNQLVWNYGADGLTNIVGADLRAFGIEMVFVPQGSYQLGDGQTNAAQTYGNFENGAFGIPLSIQSENALTLGGGQNGSLGNNNRMQQFVNGGGGSSFDCSNDGCLGGSGDDFSDIASQQLPAAFPKGFQAYYCMKYELTLAQLTDMLNCLQPAQQGLLAATGHFFVPGGGTFSSVRFDIQQAGGQYMTPEQYVPWVFADWIRLAAYADWSALRPMTELEFEKACRGTANAVAGEYAWGNSSADLSDNFTLNQLGTNQEGIASGYQSNGTAGNVWVRAGNQTMNTVARVGIFAAHPQNSGRVTSGASFWGIHDLSGNAWERTVSVGHAEGRKFNGTHGDGTLSNDGYANEAAWPGTFNAGLVNTNVGVGYRGGGLLYPTPNLEANAQVSNRRLASGYWNIVIHDDGGRFVRTEP